MIWQLSRLCGHSSRHLLTNINSGLIRYVLNLKIIFICLIEKFYLFFILEMDMSNLFNQRHLIFRLNQMHVVTRM